MVNTANLILLVFTATANPLQLSWSAPTENVDGSLIVEPLTYNVYRSHNGENYKISHAGISKTSTSITVDLVSGETECFEVTAIEGGVESSPTLPTCITVP